MLCPEYKEIHWKYSDTYWAGRPITDCLVMQRIEDEFVNEFAGCYVELVDKVLRDGDHITIMVAVFRGN